ncbi:aldehyde dehydrogenase family protein [Tropicibacter sp. Alg240-R139]|uniref:aldehyde dehydrogenase family protein n=1 Tax=Tropicibacter sp. Alg240-R139 TaxID=2305991 RepID=UPI0013DEEAE7|nr:aldehyde dehydrogenase family protein [Tropicibacter sp. Alg240-R139]
MTHLADLIAARADELAGVECVNVRKLLSQVGRDVMQAAPEPVAESILQQGGKSSVVIWPDADLDVSADGIGREKGLSGLRAYLAEKSNVLNHGEQP